MNNQMISLRALKEKDAVRMLEWMNHADVVQYMKIGERKHTLDEVLGFIKNAKMDKGNFHYAIADQNDIYLGTVSLKNIDTKKGSAEYAIALHPDAIGLGIAALATSQVLKIAFSNLNLQEVYLNVLAENTRAIRFYEKFGWEYRKKSKICFDGTVKTLIWYRISKGMGVTLHYIN